MTPAAYFDTPDSQGVCIFFPPSGASPSSPYSSKRATCIGDQHHKLSSSAQTFFFNSVFNQQLMLLNCASLTPSKIRLNFYIDIAAR